MHRFHLFEVEDQSWCPRPVRDGVTAQLAFIAHASDGFAVIVPRLLRAIERTGETRILDLASGPVAHGSGPRKRYETPDARSR